jgi:hypothetical protein
VTAIDYGPVVAAPATSSPPPLSDRQREIAAVLRDLLYMAMTGDERSRQVEPGPSELGNECDLALGYKALGHHDVHFTDPLARFVGTGTHGALAAAVTHIDGGRQRYLVEAAVKVDGIRGHTDLHDRRLHAVVDWKTSTKAKIKEKRRKGVPVRTLVQLNLYAHGLREAGETVEDIVVVYLPVDGTLDDVWVYSAPVDPDVASFYLDRYARIRETATTSGLDALTPTPTALCGWCDFYNPSATQRDQGCRGQQEGK